MNNFSTGTRFTAAGVEGIHTVFSVKGGIVYYTDPSGIERKGGETVLNGFVSAGIITIVGERTTPTPEEFVAQKFPGTKPLDISMRAVALEVITEFLATQEA